MNRLSLILLAFLPGCVSTSYMNKRVQEVEDRVTACQGNWQTEMRAADACEQDFRDGKCREHQEQQYDLNWKKSGPQIGN